VMETPDDLSDEELLRRFNEGDADAFERLVRRYERPLYNFILRSVRRRERADELLQDVFLKVVQRSRDFKGNSKLSTWLYTIARNLCIDHSRKMVFRRHKSLDAPSRSGEEEGPTLLERQASDAPEADRAAIAKDLQAHLGRGRGAARGAARGLPAAAGGGHGVQGDRGRGRGAGEHREEPDALRARAPAAGTGRVSGLRSRAEVMG